MRLIDADALKDEVMKIWAYIQCITGDDVMDAVMTDIKNAPTVDAIPREWWEQLRASVEDLRDNNEYDTDSDMFQTMKCLANLMKVIEGKHEVD